MPGDIPGPELDIAAEVGLRLVVDLTSEGLQPDRVAAAKAAASAGIDVVFGVGHYREPHFSTKVREESAEQRADRWLSAWKHGFEDGTFPGIVGEIGTSPIISPDELKSLLAAAMVSVETGSSISVHVDPFSGIEAEIASILLSESTDPSRIVMSHIDSEFVEVRVRQLVDLGVYIELDQFGAPPEGIERGRHLLADSERIKMIESLVSWGAEDRVLLSHDVCCRNQWSCWGGSGFALIGTRVRSELIHLFGEDLSTKLLWENPMRMLSVPTRKT